MKSELGMKYLISTDNWFIAPDGQSYKAVFGTVTGVHSDDEIIGIKTNRNSTNWVVVIGNMIVAGCQIHYCIQTDLCEFNSNVRDVEYNGSLRHINEYGCRIYNSDTGDVN